MSAVRFEEVVELDVPADDAWAVLADYGLDPSWRAEVVSMVPTPPGPVAVGTTTEEVAKVLGSTFTTPGEVVAVGPGRSFAWRASSSSADVAGTRAVEPLGSDRCRVTLAYELRAKGATRLLGPVLTRSFRRAVRSNLPRLARVVEARAAEASSR